MKKILYTLLACGLFGAASAFTPHGLPFADSTDQREVKHNGIYSFTGMISDFSNWNAGGEDNINGSIMIREQIDVIRGRRSMVHLFEANYGLNYQNGYLSKIADRIEWTSTLTAGEKGVDQWGLSGQFNVRSQFAPGYTKGDTVKISPISTLGSPLYAQLSLGIGSHHFEHWTFYLAPVAGKGTWVLDSALAANEAFGVAADRPYLLEGGAKATVNYSRQFTDEFRLVGKADAFWNYASSDMPLDIAGEIIAVYKVKEWFSVNGQFQFIRDLDAVAALQTRSTLGIGLTFTY